MDNLPEISQNRKVPEKIIISILVFLLGFISLMSVIVTSSFSSLFTPVIDSVQDTNKLFSDSGTLNHPYAEFRFRIAFYTGLFLYEDDENIPTDWVMCGLVEDRFVPFFLTVDNPDVEPEDMENMSYILRFPSKPNAQHIEWTRGKLTDDLISENGISQEEALEYFTDGVLQASRNERTVSKIVMLSGILFMVCGLTFLIFANSERKKEIMAFNSTD